MPRHRRRQHATHRLTAERDAQTGVDDYDTPIYDSETVVENELVEYDAGGAAYVRGSTGERVQRAPTITGRGALGHNLREGDTITLSPLDDAADPLEDLEIVSIDVEYGRRARAGEATIELETN